MAGFRLLSLHSLCKKNLINTPSKLQSFQSYDSYYSLSRCVNRTYVRSLCADANHVYYNGESNTSRKFVPTHVKVLGFGVRQYSKTRPTIGVSSVLSNPCLRTAVPFVSTNPILRNRWYSSSSSDLGDKVRSSWQSAVEGVNYAGDKAKEAYDGLAPHVHQLLDAYPYIKDVVVPFGWTLTGTVMAWVVMPKILRRLHKYSMQTPAGSIFGEQVPYEKGFWGTLEDPVRYLVTFMAFSQISAMVAPDTIAAQYLAQAWRGAAILSLLWFLHRWKTNVFSRLISAQNLATVDREKLLTLDKVSSVGLFVIGIMALAEACGVAVQSILTVGGIGGVATAFAARDILGNVLSGLFMQFSKPFSLGDTIKAGSLEGQVIEMGLTTTSLLTAEKFPVLVPNSLFSSQVIVNKSRGQWRALYAKIPIRTDDQEKIPEITDHIKRMLRSNPNVFLDKEAPYCFLSRIEISFAELTLGCNLKRMSKEEWYSTQQDILLQSVRIIKEHGATLGNNGQENSL